MACQQQPQQTMKWGDIIRIHGVSTNPQKPLKGLIISKGFTDPNIYYQTFVEYKEVNFYRESLFQILPKSNFDLHDQLLFDEKVKVQEKDALKERCRGEIEQLEINLKLKYADKEKPELQQVVYGSEVIFKHIESGEYLSGVYKAADIGEGAFKLQLVKDLSSQLIFRLQSHRSYEQDGNSIYYDDCLQIHHVQSDCYMNFPEANTPIILDKPYEVAKFERADRGYQFAECRPNIKKPIGHRINVINENKPKCLWKFIQHCRYADTLKTDKIKSHDIVFFQHTKQKGLIASTLAQQKYYLKEIKVSSEDAISYECFWELLPTQGSETSPERCSDYWARNIVTGQILTFNSVNVEIRSKEIMEDGGFKSEGLVNLICKDTQVQLLLQRGANLPNDENVIDVIKYLDSNINKIDFKSVISLTEDSFIIVRVSDETIRSVAYILSSQQAFVKIVQIFSTQLKNKNSNPDSSWIKDFFMRLNEDLLASFITVLKLLAGKIYDTDYDNIEASGNSPTRQIQKILVQTGIAQLVIEIIFTLYEPFLQIQSNHDITQDKAIRIKVAQIFELSYNLVQKIVKDFQDNKIYFSRWIELFLEHSSKINKMCIQQTLVTILQNNPISIQSMIKHQTIDSLINGFFTQVKINKEAALKEDRENRDKDFEMPTKHLRLFSTFIKGENAVFKDNQKYILGHFFNNQHNDHNEQVDYTFKFKVEYTSSQVEEAGDDITNKQKNKVVKVIHGTNDPCTLTQFYQKFPSKFDYLLSYVNLLADVCMDRNNEAIQYVQSNLPLAVLPVVLFSSEIKKLNAVLKENKKGNIHEPFIRIGHHAYVNNLKFSPIRRIRKIVKWYKEDDGEVAEVDDITRTKRVYEGQKEEQEKICLQYLLIYIARYLETCDRQISNLQILYTVLNFLKETILLGLWETIDKFRRLIPLLIKNIIRIEGDIFFEQYDQLARKRYIGKEWVNLRKGGLKMNRPQIALAIKCKTKATQIFKYINEMEIDIRLRFMMNFFQGIYEATENVQNYSQTIDDQVNEEAIGKIQDQGQRQSVLTRNEAAKEQFYKIFGTNILGEVKKYSEDEDMLMKSSLWYNKIKTMIPLEYSEPSEDIDKDRDLFKYAQQHDFSTNKIVLSLFELSGYYNKNLLSSSLNMLRAMFGQRSDIIDNYKNILLCGRGNLSLVYSNLKFMRNKFAMLKNDTIMTYDGTANKQFAYAIFKPYDHLGREEDKRSGIIQDLFFLARTLKDNVSLKNIESLMHVDKQVFDKSIVYLFYNQKQKNNDLFQQLNLAEGIYDPLIQYIKIIKDKELPQTHRLLLFSIYQYLTLLCFNNMKAKHLFMQYIPDILLHLNKRVGAAQFLYEVCINNKILVNNQEMVDMIFDKALLSCNSMKVNEQEEATVSYALKQGRVVDNRYETSRILHSLRGLLIFNDEGHKTNQRILLNKLSDNRFRDLVVKKKSMLYTAKKEQFNMNPEVTYITTHFELFSALVESENLINIGKLQNLHPYQYCLNCLNQTNRWQLRRAMRSYINRLYYVHKDKDIFVFQEFIRKEFSIINRELTDLIELHRSKMLTEELKVKNGIRFTYAQSQIILLILQILITLHQMFLKPRFNALVQRQLGKQEKFEEDKKKLHKTLIILLRNLGCIAKIYPNTKTIASFIREIVSLMKTHIFKLFPIRYLQKMSQPVDKSAKQPEENAQESKAQAGKKSGGVVFDRSKTFFRNLIDMIRYQKQQQKQVNVKKQFIKNKNQMDVSENDLRERYIKTIFQVPEETLRPINAIKIKEQEEYHYRQHLQTANSKMFKLLAKPEFEENQQNLQLNSRLNNVKQLLNDSPVFKKLKQDQFYKLVRMYNSMDDISSEIYAAKWKQVEQQPRAVFSKREIITNCFKLIIENPDIIKDEQKIFVIKLVRCYIAQAVEQNQNHKLSVDKWSADYYTDQSSSSSNTDEGRSQLVKRQHQIEECGGSKFLLSIFKENLYAKNQLLNEALLFGVIYLYNGNTHCQNSILAELVADTNNTALVSIRGLIRSISYFLIQVRRFKENEKKRDFSYKIVDSYDHLDAKENILVKMFGHKTDKFEIQTELNYELALCRIFRFLQLFCENNNIGMKKFVMDQTNEDGGKKIVTINFIQEACQILRQIFKIMSSKVTNIPPSILNFINQITQIPCLDCQQSFMKTTFFEDMSYMAGFFEDKVNIEQRKFNFFLDPQKDPDEDPLSTLYQIYQQGVGLALSNFQGNNDLIFNQFLNKCQPRYFWIVIRQNLIKLLRPMASKFGVSRETIEKQLEQKNQKSTNEEEKSKFIQFREYIVEKAFIKSIFSRFDDKKITKFIIDQSALDRVFGQEICNIINVLAILKQLDDYAEIKKRLSTRNPEVIDREQQLKAYKAKKFRQDLYKIAMENDQYVHIKEFVHHLERQVLAIEISADNGEKVDVQNLYFPKHPVFSYLAADTKNQVMFNVGRQTRRDKLITLQDRYDQLKEEIESNYQLKYYKLNVFGKHVPLSITSGLIDQIRVIARNVSYLICALMLYMIVVEHDTQAQESYFTFFTYNEKFVMRAICLIQLLLTLFMLALWIKMRLSLCLSKRKKAQEDQAAASAVGQGGQEEVQEQVQIEKPPPQGYLQKAIFYALAITHYFFKILNSFSTIGQKLKQIFYDDMMSLFGFRHISYVVHLIVDPIINFIKNIYIGFMALLVYQSGFLSILVFVIAAVMGNFVGIQWYVIHLFQFFVGVSLLTNVFKSVIDNIGELTLLTAFATCFILVFNILSLNTYTFVIYQDDNPAQSCMDIVGCVLQVYTSGAIGGDMDQIYPGRFTFDTVYVIFMEILFSNLVSGIMIDGFGSLKEADAERDADKYNICYICALTKPDMEKQGSTFNKHKEKHFLWNYLFYRYVVKMKDPSDYTGLQYSISTQIDGSQINWFPDNGEKDQSGALQELMTAIKDKVGKMTQDINTFIGKQTGQISNGTGQIGTLLEEKANKLKQQAQPAALVMDEPLPLEP